MPRPKSYGDFFIYGNKMDLPVFISTNTIQGRNKYILNLKSLIDTNNIGKDELYNIRKKISRLSFVLSTLVNTDTTLDIIFLRGADWKDKNVDDTQTLGDIIKTIIQDEVTTKILNSTSTTTPNTNAIPSRIRIPSTDSSTWQALFEAGDEVLVRIDFAGTVDTQKVFKINSVETVRDFKRPENPSGRLYHLSDSGGSWEGKDLELAKIQQSTSTTTPTTTSAPAMKLTRAWKPYYVMPKTGIQIFQDENAPNKNLFLFYIPEFPYGHDGIDNSEIKDFLTQIKYLSVFGSSNYYYAEKLGFLPSQDSYAIEFDFLTLSLPSLDVQEMIFKQIDQKLIEILGIADYSPPQSSQKKYTIDDIINLQRGDLVKINNGKEFNIELTIKRDEKKGVSDGKLADMRDINDGTSHVDIFYPYDWFRSYIYDPEFTVEIIKGGANDDAIAMPSTLSVAEDDLQRAKKELSQLLMLKSFTSSVEFERKIQINQKISEVQKRINDLNFKILERKTNKDDIFEDLFEQSFTPINNTYTEVYAPSSDGSGEGVSADFFAPDGSPSKLSDSLNELIRTPQFLEWFGNWQLAYAYKDTNAVDISCSKVVTKDYEPLVVWHGTGQQFSYFRFDNFPAAYFAVNWRYSKWFADLQGGGNGYTIPFFLNIRNPLDLTRFETRKIKAKEFFDYIYLMTGMTMVDLEVNPLFMDTNAPAVEPWVYLRNNAKMLKKLSENHVFDGIHFYETNPNVPVGESAHRTEAFITFTAEQCKVADPNRGLLLFASLKSFLLKQGGKI